MSKLTHNNIAWHIDRRRQKRALKRGWAKHDQFSRAREHFWRDDQWMRSQWRANGYDVPLDH